MLRPFSEDDIPYARELATDPYVPLIGTLPAHATEEQARDWLRRQHTRWARDRLLRRRHRSGSPRPEPGRIT